MQMMYDIVARELKALQLQDSHPQDFLNFYCLGKREKVPEETSNNNEAMVLFQNDHLLYCSDFMIYLFIFHMNFWLPNSTSTMISGLRS